jgi:hypothetical protein
MKQIAAAVTTITPPALQGGMLAWNRSGDLSVEKPEP